MKPKDNSDITMLIFSDYLEEIGLVEQAQEIRERLDEIKVNQQLHTGGAFDLGVSKEGRPSANTLVGSLGAGRVALEGPDVVANPLHIEAEITRELNRQVGH
jgi:hypothetical protein